MGLGDVWCERDDGYPPGGEVDMSDNEDRIVDELLDSNLEFRRLFEQHRTLDEQIHDAETGVAPLDNVAIGTLKKRKLLAKDQMAAFIADYRREHA